jgi:DNA repair protein RadC
MKYPKNLELTIIDDSSLGKVSQIKDAKDFMPEIKLTLKKSTGKEITNEFKVTSAEETVKLIKRLYPRGVMSLNERFFVIFFNHANRPIAWFNVSIGAKAATVLEPSYIVAAASKLNANSVIISHNHPSGNLVPSQADKILTQKLANALFLINVQILDHVIATEDSYYSFRENGLEYVNPSNQNEYRNIAGLQGTKKESNTADQLNTLRQAINKALANCLRMATPYVCSMAETEKGYITIEKQIIELCLAKQIAPAQAILLIESEYNVSE